MLDTVYSELLSNAKKIRDLKDSVMAQKKNNELQNQYAIIFDFIDCIIEESQNIISHQQSISNNVLHGTDFNFLEITLLQVEKLYNYISDLKNFLHGFDYPYKIELRTIQHNVRSFAELRFYNCTRSDTLPKINNNLVDMDRLGQPKLVSYPSILIWQDEVLRALFTNIIYFFEIIEKSLFQFHEQ
jgi:hypothetical protein